MYRDIAFSDMGLRCEEGGEKRKRMGWGELKTQKDEGSTGQR
jgi:hypothetical protein